MRLILSLEDKLIIVHFRSAIIEYGEGEMQDIMACQQGCNMQYM